MSTLPLVDATVQTGTVERPDPTSTCCFTGDAKLLRLDGTLASIRYLAAEYVGGVDIASIDKYGRLTNAVASNFTLEECVSELYTLAFKSGMRIQASPFQRFRTTNGDWVQVQDLEFGDALTSAIYNPNHRFPSIGTDEIQHVHRNQLAEPLELYSFTVTDYQSCLLANQDLSDERVTLLASSSWKSR